MTRIVPWEEGLFEAASELKGGKVVAFPTETVYGLGALVGNEKGLSTLFEVKGRPQDNPLIVHVESVEMAEEVGEVSLEFLEFARYWPGPLTLVTKAKKGLSSLVTGGRDTVGIRIPSHPAALALIRQVGPIAAPSANLSGRPSPTSAIDVLEDLEGRIELILEGGSSEIGVESTVVLLEPLRLLRPGSIEIAELQEDRSMFLAPGMKYRHYAPKASLQLVEAPLPDTNYLLSRAPVFPHPFRELSRKNFYRSLREADRGGFERIDVLLDEETRKDLPLMNRLEKALSANEVNHEGGRANRDFNG